MQWQVRLLPIGLLFKVGAMYLHYSGTPAMNYPLQVILLVLVGTLVIVGTDPLDILRLVGKNINEHSQQRDAANFFTHQHLVRQGVIESYIRSQGSHSARTVSPLHLCKLLTVPCGLCVRY